MSEAGVKVFRISDLIGRKKRDSEEPLKKRTLLAKKYRHRKGGNSSKEPENIVMEASSFKVSNKLTVYGIPKVKKVKQVNDCDILQLHSEALKKFEKLQKTLPKKERQLVTDKNLSDRQQKQLREEIEGIKKKILENDYHEKTAEIIEKYRLKANALQKDTSAVGLMKFIDKYDNKEKQRLAEEYCRVTNNGLLINPKKLEFDNTVCEECSGDTRTIEGFVTCTDCGLVSSKTVHDFQVSYKDLCDTTIKTNFSYKRINRFKEILATLQAKENTDIPSYVIEAVKNEINKENNLNLETVDVKKIKYYLKRLSLTTFYEHAPNILNTVIGKKALNITSAIEEKLLEMFSMIQEPFEKAKAKITPNRQSFLSYNYILAKLTELLGLHHLQKHFSLLKSPEKLKTHDKIWKEITKSLKWAYIPTI